MDADGDNLVYALGTDASNGSATIDADGNYIYTPDSNFFGTDSFTYTLTDADGASTTATVTITVNSVNDEPVVGIAIDDQADLDSDTITLDVSGNFADTENDSLAYSAVGLPAGLSIDSDTGIISGTIDSSASVPGSYTVQVTVNDGNGGSVSDTFTWTVTNPAPTAGDDTNTTDEDTVVSGNVTANDADSDGDVLTYSLDSDASDGTATIDSNGNYTYTPDTNFFGTDSFTYTVTDADGASTTATVTITVASVNDEPVVGTAIDDQSDLDSDTISLDVSGNFNDVDGDSLTFTSNGLPTGLSIDAAGLITGTIDSSASANGDYTVTVTASDGNGGSVSDTFTWTVANPGPVANDDSFVTDEDTAFSGSVASGPGADSDPDGDDLTFSQLSNPDHGVVTFNSDGSFSYTPTDDYNGSDSFTYTATDADGATATATVNIEIISVNDGPEANVAIDDQTNFDSDVVSVDVSGNFSDVDGDGLTFSATGLPGGLSIDANGLISGTIDSSASAAGPYTVEVTVVDGNGGSVSDTFTWTVANTLPTAGDDANSTDEDTSVSGSVIANDGDVDGDDLSYSLLTSSVDGTVSIDSDGNYTYTPNSNFFGIDSFEYTVTDADGATTTATVEITVASVNDEPIVGTAIEDQSNFDSEEVSLDVAGNFSDVEDANLTFSAAGLPPGLSIDGNGLINGTLDSSASANGPYAITVTASDSDGGSVSDTFTWTVANTLPTAGDDSNATDEDTAVSGSVIANDADVDGDDLTYSLNSVASNGTATIDADGNYTYTPDGNFFGSDSFEYTVTDADGAATTATVTITVGSVNDEPVVGTAIDDQSDLDSDTITLDVSGNFSDVEDADLAFTATGLPPGLTINGDGLITGTIDSSASASGPYTVVVTATDDDGGIVSDEFVWTVANTLPTAGDDTNSTDEDTAVSGSVIANDGDVDGDDLKYSLDSDASNGTATIDADGNYTYTPADNFFGTDSFTYTVTDADGAITTATVTITVNSINDEPVVGTAIDDQTDFDSDTISLDVSGNFTDVEDANLTFAVTGLPAGLTINAAGLITGTIDSSASADGPYTVTVTAADSDGGSVSDTFTWAVANPGPVAGNDSFTIDEDTTIAQTVVGNDGDVDGDVLTYAKTSEPTNGTVTLATDGTFTYTPVDNFFGTDSFTYTVTDADGATAVATVTITVDSVNDAPKGNALPDQSDSDADVISVDVSTAFSDIENDDLTFSAIDLPPGLSINADTGVITGTLERDASQTGPYNVTVTADDGNGGTADVSFKWTVDNPGPVANTDNGSVNENAITNGNVITNDTDLDGDELTVTAVDRVAGNVNKPVAGDAGGTFTIYADGSYDFDPGTDFDGLAEGEEVQTLVTYTISDGNGGSDTATLFVTVTGVNDGPATIGNIPDQNNLDAETPVAIDTSIYFDDVDDDSLTYSATDLPGGLTINLATGDISGTIDADASVDGTFNVVVTATDSQGAAATQNFTWTVDNPGPIANDDSNTATENETVFGWVNSNDSDPDGDLIRVESIKGSKTSVGVAVAGSDGGTFVINGNGSYDFHPGTDFDSLAEGQSATTSIDYTITDDQGGTATATLTITVTGENDAPETIGNPGDQANNDAEAIAPVNVTTYFTDADSGDVLTYDATGLPAGLSINSDTGEISGTIDNSASLTDPYNVVVTATDSQGDTTSLTFVWTVDNPGPSATNDSNTTDEESVATGNVLTNDSDPDLDTISVNAIDGFAGDVGSPVSGNAGGTFVINTDGSYSFDPGTDFDGSAFGESIMTSVEYTITDGEGGTATATLTITVDGVNDAPTAERAIDDQTNQDSDTITPIDASTFFDDVDGDMLTYSITGLPQGLTIDSVTGEISGTIDSSASVVGTYSVVVMASDGNGGIATQSFDWTVTNPAPDAVDDSFNTMEDTQVSGDASANDSDVDGDSVTFALVSNPADGVVTFRSDGTFEYTPDANYSGVDSFEYSITDADGATTVATVRIIVGDVNDPPVIVTPMADQTNLDNDDVTLDVSGNFSDAENDSLTYAATDLPPGLSIDADTGVISGTIDSSASVNSIYDVVISVDDGNGGQTSDSFVWAIGNPAPTATDNQTTIDEDATTPALGNVITGDTGNGVDTDPDGDLLVVSTVGGEANDVGVGITTQYGTLQINGDGSYSFTVDPTNGDVQGLGDGESLNESISYTISDGEGGSSTANLTIVISGVNDAPEAQLIPAQDDFDHDTATTEHIDILQRCRRRCTGL